MGGLDWLAAIIAIMSATMIRWRWWQGYALALPAQALYAYICIDRGLYGFLLLVAFYLINSSVGLLQWRRLAVVPEATAYTMARASQHGE